MVPSCSCRWDREGCTSLCSSLILFEMVLTVGKKLNVEESSLHWANGPLTWNISNQKVMVSPKVWSFAILSWASWICSGSLTEQQEQSTQPPSQKRSFQTT